MNSIPFENLIGKNISQVSYIFDYEGFENELFGEYFYYRKHGDFKYYNGVPYSILSVTKNEQKTITAITIHFYEIVDDSFFNSLISSYGNPNTILVVDSLDIEKKRKLTVFR